MQNINNINEHINRLTMPLKDIYTTVYTVKTDSGDLLFDTATYDTDVSDAVLPLPAFFLFCHCIFVSDMVK